MTAGPMLILAIAALTIVAAPLAWGMAGAMSARRAHDDHAAIAGSWRLTAASTLLYVLAFNLTFFIQELFLVLPKALTPGLRPTLYHNNHGWEGTNPLAGLFQGTGALATLAVGLFCLWTLGRPRKRSDGTRLFLYWMAYCGCFMALPQVVIGSLSPGSDVGMAMSYLHLGETARIGAGLLALGLMPVIALQLRRPALELAHAREHVESPGSRARFVFRVITLPALLATALVIPFRVPRELLEVLVVPLLVLLCGVPWIQAGAWRVREVKANGSSTAPPLAYLFAAALGLLLLFQLVLRPGIRFY
ncbi:hypothetical protein EAH88_00065 [Rhodanobacter glycinis]|uniref:Uncharacterized protein n=1 Tax=Rhodanobacter glycinis TaxID=582702 RepID=A0A502CDD5_9GAMM|nr:hypothetical protein [Rhodanobacter glycinis]TPG10998.1 hypothetical protein EAH88_00065 [Rhodanobacter glycinis]